MARIPHEIAEEFALEILSRAHAVRHLAHTLKSRPFPSPLPARVADMTERSARFLADAVVALALSSNDDGPHHEERDAVMLERLRTADRLLRKLGDHLRLAAGTGPERLPWVLVRPFTDLCRRLWPEAGILFTLHWDRDNEPAVLDFNADTRGILAEFGDLLPVGRSDELRTDLQTPLLGIAFPYLEGGDIRIFARLGQALGQMLIEREPALLPEAPSSERLVLVALLADRVMLALFGPAMIFALFDLALENGFDVSGEPSATPKSVPWSIRLAALLDVLDRISPAVLPLDDAQFPAGAVRECVNRRFHQVRRLIDELPPAAADEWSAAGRTAREKAAAAWPRLDTRLTGVSVSAAELYARVPALIDRLDHGLPPNAVEHGPDDRSPATLAEIVTAGWFQKICWEDRVFHDVHRNEETFSRRREDLNRLVLKAVDFAHLERTYRGAADKIAGGEEDR